jgi:DNA-binding transcriptional LysR family regulator
MRLSLDAIEVLDAIERKGSFAAAAAELNRVPSAITYTVQQLESAFDVLLFDRSQHRATLTQAGHELLNEGRPLLNAASALEHRIHQLAKGWEPELRIAVDTIIGAPGLYPLVASFFAEYENVTTTRLRISEEVLGGSWDALIAGRADLVIGASGERPISAGLACIPLRAIEFIFVAAPGHPILQEQQPLTESTIQRYRAVSVADSSRSLAPRTVGLLSGQPVFTVSTMRAKLDAHIAGLGVGYLPSMLAEPEIAASRLIALNVATGKPIGTLFTAWRANRTGKALRWFAQQLEQPGVIAELFGDVTAKPVKKPRVTSKRTRKI